MASFLFDGAMKRMLTGQINFADDSFSVMLATANYFPEQNVDEYRSDVKNYEVRGRGYQSGGVPIDLTVTHEADRFVIGLGGAVWPEASITARFAIYFQDNESIENDVLIALIDFGGDVSSSNADWSLTASTLAIR